LFHSEAGLQAAFKGFHIVRKVISPVRYKFLQNVQKKAINAIYMLFFNGKLCFLKGFDDGISQSELLGFWTFSIVRYSRK
jgi:hypothetical protein